MPRLKDRNKQIPNGFKFLQPQTNWKPPRFASFDQIVRGLMQHRKGNQFLAAQHNWATDYETVANEVDEFNARICQQMGWDSYIAPAAGGQPAAPPFHLQGPGLLQKLGAVAAGGRVLIEWLKSGAEAVPQELANSRAEFCSNCPKNNRGDWTAFFTVPVSEAIRRAMSDRSDWGLTTPHDVELKVCSACYCPLPLKVHMPIKKILEKMPQESFDELVPGCWIRMEKESKG